MDVGVDVEIGNLPVGAAYTIKTAGGSGGTRDTQYNATNGDGPVTYVTNGATDPVPAPVSITGTVPANGIVALSITEIDAFAYCSGFSMDVQASSTPTINNVDGDNAVNQYQQAIVDVSGFAETITTATLGGVACTIPENDPADNQITVGMPGTGLATGTYDFVISGSTETDTITGISYTVTHEFTAPYEPVDSNSLFAGQLLTSDSYHRIVTPPTNGTLDTATAEADSLWGNDVDDIYTPNEGFTGDDTVTLEILYSDGTTAQWTATITVEAPDTVGPVVQSVSVPTAGTYAAGEVLSLTVNWDEATTVTGTPALNLDIGGSARQANYASGSGTNALVFTYTVQTDDEDTDGITVSSLTLDGGTIKDAAGNDATLTLNAVGDTSAVLVDGVAPVISIDALTTTDTTPVVSGSAGDAASLTLVVDGVTYNPTPSGGAWSQQLNTLAPATYTMTLDGQDSAGNAATQQTATLTVNEVPPLVSRQRFKMSIETTTIRMSL